MWNNFSQLSGDVETIRKTFSTRELYRISSSELVTIQPTVRASIQNKRIIIVIDNNLIILSDDEKTECRFLSFDSKIDAYCTPKNASLVLCGLADGNIHGIHSGYGVPLFSLTINTQDICNDGTSSTILEIESIGTEYIIACCNGTIYKISNIDETRLTELYEEKVKCNDSIISNVLIEELKSLKIRPPLFNQCNSKIQSFKIAVIGVDINDNDTNKPYTIIEANQKFIYLRNVSLTEPSTADDCSDDDLIELPEHMNGVKRLFFVSDSLFAISFSGDLFEICLYTKILFRSAPENRKIDDLIVIEGNGNEVELVVLFKPEGEKRCMKIVSFPSFNCTLDLEVPAHTWLINQSKSAVNLDYLTGTSLQPNNIVNQIEIKCISIFHPEERYKKLIAKGCIEEATLLAEENNLSLQPIYEAQIKMILIDINQPNGNGKIIEDRFKGMLEVLEKIESTTFLLQLRPIELPNRNLMHDFLTFLSNRLDTLPNNDPNLSEKIIIRDQLRRLKTLHHIDPYECYAEWQKFVFHPNIIAVCEKMFKTDISISCIVFRQHSSSIIPYLDVEGIYKLFNKIPSTLSPDNIIQWLRHFIPIALPIYPELMSFLINWSIGKIHGMQFESNWPDSGLKYTKDVLSIFIGNIMDPLYYTYYRRNSERSDIGDISYHSVDNSFASNSANGLDKIHSIQESLEELCVLKKSYNLSINYDDYIHSSMEDIAFKIMQRVSIINYKKIVDHFLIPVFNEKNKLLNPVLERYVQFLIGNHKNIETWQERSMAAIEYLQDGDERMGCILSVLKAAPVPWSNLIKSLIKYSECNHPLAKEIRIEFDFEKIKIIKVNYGWGDASDSIKKLVYRIVRENRKEMCDDLLILFQNDPSIRCGEAWYVIYQLAIVRGQYEEALKFGRITESIIDHKLANEIVLNLIAEELIDHQISNGIKYFNEIQLDGVTQNKLNRLKLIHWIQNRFDSKPNGSLINCSDRDALNIGIGLIKNSLLDIKANIIDTIWNDVFILTKYLPDIECIEGFVNLLDNIQSLDISTELIKNVLENISINFNNSIHFIHLAVILIVQQMKIITDSESISNIMAFPFAYKLLVKALPIDISNYIIVEELLKCLRVVYDMFSQSEIEHHLKIKLTDDHVRSIIESFHVPNSSHINERSNRRESMSIFDEVSVRSVQTRTTNKLEVAHNNVASVIICVSYGFNLMLSKTLNKPSLVYTVDDIILQIFKIYMKDDILHSKQSIDDATSKLYGSLEKIVKLRLHSESFHIMKQIISYQKRNSNIIIHDNYADMIYRKILQYSIKQKEPNFKEMLGILLSCKDKQCCLTHLKDIRKNGLIEVNYLTLIELYNTFNGDDEWKLVELEKDSRIKSYYNMKLYQLYPAMKQSEKCFDFISIDDLMAALPKHEVIDIKLLEDLCLNLRWDFQEALVAQIISILNQQDLIFDIKVSTYDKEEIHIRTTTDEIMNTCLPFLKKVTNIEHLIVKLKSFTPSINYYFYELYLCTIAILKYVNGLPVEWTLWEPILLFLQHHMRCRRRNRINQIETDWWLKTQNEIGILPKIAKYRFPFRMIIEQPLKNILDDEISIDNCDKWFPLIKLYALLTGGGDITQVIDQQDYFCMSAVKNSINELKDSQLKTWNVQPRHTAFLQSILRLIEHVHNPSKKLFILYFTTNQMAEGADQVEAARVCCQFATEHECELASNKKANEIIPKIKRKYPIMKTQYLLHQYGFQDDKLLQLVETPKELLNLLYSKEYIMLSNQFNINRVAQEIAELHNINFNIVQMELLSQWLGLGLSTDYCGSGNMDETYCDLNISIDENTESYKANIMRAHYILRSWEPEKSKQFLISRMFPIDGSTNNTRSLFIYECFKLLMDSDPNINYNDILKKDEYIALKCIYFLNQIGYKFQLSSFYEYDKVELLKRIWTTQCVSGCNQIAIELMSIICIEYSIFVPKIWNGILKQMCTLKMFKQLQRIIDLVSTKQELLSIDGLVEAWNYIIQIPFNHANIQRSDKQETELMKAIFQLQSCPVVWQLNLLELVRKCTQLNRCHLGSICIAFMTEDNTLKAIKMIKEHSNLDTLKNEIISLEQNGIYSFITKYVINKLKL